MRPAAPVSTMRTLTVVRVTAVLGLALTLAAAHFLTASPTPEVAAGIDLVVDDDDPSCQGSAPNHSTVGAAVNAASAGDFIFVCAGTYTEQPISISDPITIQGPGATPAEDGVAYVQRVQVPSASGMISVQSSGVSIQGLDLDAGIAGVGSTSAIVTQGPGGHDNLDIGNNVIHGAAGSAISIAGANASIYRNHFYDNTPFVSATCICDNSFFETNIFDDLYARMEGSGNQFITNEMTGDVHVQFVGPNGLVDDNYIDGGGVATLANSLIRVAGDGVTVSNNQLHNTPGYALYIQDDLVNNVSSDVTVIDNLFDNVTRGIHIAEHDPNDGDHLSVDVGVVPQDANIFTNSGGTLGDGLYLLSLQTPANINAENNNWGYCLEEDIEAEVSHQPDNTDYGFVDFVPFINPAVCPTPVPTPTPSPSPTPTPEPTPTPLPTPTGFPTVPAPATLTPTPPPTPTATPPPQFTQGDNDCDGDSDAVDALVSLQSTAALPYNQQPDCLKLGGAVPVWAAIPAGGPQHLFGDIDCDGDVDAVDALQILRNVAGLPVNQGPGCPTIGQPLG